MEAHFEAGTEFGENVDLFVGYGLPLPGETNFLYASTNLGGVEEFVRVSSCTQTNPIEGPWYLAVVNREATTFRFWVSATEYVPEEPDMSGEVITDRLMKLTNGVGYTLPGKWYTYFTFDVSNAVQVDLEILNPEWNIDMFAVQASCLPMGPRTNYGPVIASTNAGTANELIRFVWDGSNYVRTPITFAVFDGGRDFLCIIRSARPPGWTTGRILSG